MFNRLVYESDLSKSYSNKTGCQYAYKTVYENGTYHTLCDCPGGCRHKIETTKTGRGLIGRCGIFFKKERDD